ncbi:MAG: transcriptional regulator NrdR [Lachnospiraceae bacterium]|jgi:transcriptional repressor NrdR
MKCPYCGAEDTRVTDSRPNEDNTAVRRRRECGVCGRRFTTWERAEKYPLMVIKKDQSREPYNREKIRQGLVAACHKRPVSAEQMDKLIDEVESEIFADDVREVQSSRIGELVMEKLRSLDQVAYVRFASVYRSFTDVENFANELKELQKENRAEKTAGPEQ